MQHIIRILDQLSYRLERREFTVDGRELTACVSEECWDALADICLREGVTLQDLVAKVARRMGRRNLSMELDLFALAYFQGVVMGGPLHGMEPANLLPC